MAESVLVTTHDLPLAGQLRKGFRRAGYRVELLAKGEDISYLRGAVLLVVTGGLDAAGGDDTDEASRTAEQGMEMGIPVFVVGADPEPPHVAAAFPAPPDPDEIVVVGRRAIERQRLREATGIVGETDAMVEVLERIVQIAPVDATVLITGESGTGKELVARGLHALSRRRQKTFIPVNMAALSETLLESELFGHEKGAFTGAIDSRRGIFELADGGTVFLDEIGEMPLQTQTKLLRVLEQQEFLRVGGQKPIQVSVRILAATNQRLPERVATGDFRKDLYYRLNVLHIALPPLRDRREDIPLLVDAFVADASKRHDRGPFKGISANAMKILVRHHWPGNVRELLNLVESMVVLAPGRQIRAEDIPDDIKRGGASTALVRTPPALAPRAGGDADPLRPQLEFIFRTMMELKVDFEDLRREFEAFRQGGADIAGTGEIVYEPQERGSYTVLTDGDARPASRVPGGADDAAVAEDADFAEPVPSGGSSSAGGEISSARDDADSVVYRPGMTLDAVERETIRAALAQVAGNRRRAAKLLGIGERTLYRKISRLGIQEDESNGSEQRVADR